MVQDGRDPLTGERRSLRKVTAAPPPGRRRDTDLGERAVRLNVLVAAAAGFVLGAALAYLLMKQRGVPLGIALLCPFGMSAGVAGLALLITQKAGSASSALYNPTGRTTPPKREYSYAESLVARGLYEDAVTAFELAVAEDASDPTPFLRIARVYRDQLERPEDAARWFRRALHESSPPAGLAVLVRKELVELYVHRLEQPARAAPELARMAHELAGTPEGEWAARELAEVKARMAGGV